MKIKAHIATLTPFYNAGLLHRFSIDDFKKMGKRK